MVEILGTQGLIKILVWATLAFFLGLSMGLNSGILYMSTCLYREVVLKERLQDLVDTLVNEIAGDAIKDEHETEDANQ